MIDWTKFNKYPESTCYCRCEAVYRSHAKFDMTKPGLVTRKPCPACGSTENCRRVSDDPERVTIGSHEVC